MNKGVLLQVIVILITLIIVGFISLFILNNMNDRILTACESINYEGIYSFNDVDVNCTQLWETNFSNNKWSNKCSLLPFSKKILCLLKWM